MIDAALDCFAQYGVSKTTVEDVATAAGCSRATLYRYFPGKQALLDGVLAAEVDRVARRLDAAARDAATLEDALVALMREAATEFSGHQALNHVLNVEPEVVLPHLAFDPCNRLLSSGAAVVAPSLERFLPPGEALGAAEWVTRVTFTYLFSPSEHVSLTDEASVRRLVRTYVLPGLEQSVAVPAA